MSGPVSPGDVPAAPGAEVPDDPQAGENTCPDCAGAGQVDGAACAACGGSGVVVEVAGDA